MFVPLIVFVFVGLVLSAIIVNAAHAKLAASRTGSGLLGVSSLVSGIAATIFAVSLVTPRTSLADGEATDKGADAASSSATDPPPATPRVNAESPLGASSAVPSSDSATPSQNQNTEPLNTPPLVTVQIDREKRPSWVESAAVQFGDVHTIAVRGGPYLSQRECLRALDAELKKATDEFIGDYLGTPRAALLVNYDARYIKEHLVRDKVFDEVIISPSVGEMRQTHALLQFDASFRRELDERWGQIKATGRLGQVGLGVGGVLALLAAFLGYLRMDTATRGYYTGRLQFAAAVAILTIVAAGVFAARSIPWQ